jgi:hypothetical protein
MEQIGQQSPNILAAIRGNPTAFLAIINEPSPGDLSLKSQETEGTRIMPVRLFSLL